MKLNKEQKAALIKYIFGYSTKAILEDVPEIGKVWTEENDQQLRASIDFFYDWCKETLENKFLDEK